VQAMYAGHYQPAYRLRDCAAVSSRVLDPDPWCNPAMIESEPDVLLIFNHAPAADLRSPGMPKLFRMRMTDKGPVPLSP